MAFIDLVDWSDPASNTLYAWRYPATNLSTFTQLIVRESQEAVLFSKGKIIGKFGPGKHTLDTENIPLLRSFFGIPFGGKNPFTAEVWFVNKLLPLNIDWQTDSMSYHDPDYQTMIPLVAKGKYGLKLEDAERFLLQLVGTASQFNAEQLTKHFYGELVSTTKTAILQYMLNTGIGVKTVNACLIEISRALQAATSPFWEKFGFSLAGFYVTSIEVDKESDIAGAMTQQSRQVIIGATYQQDRMFEVLEKNPGGGLLGTLMLGNMMGGSAGLLQQPTPILPGTNVPAAAGTASMRSVYCSNCAKKFSSDMKFCPHCGDAYRPCPKCAADNYEGAQRCVTCGTSLIAAIGNLCSRCQNPFTGNPAFCPNCGQKVSA